MGWHCNELLNLWISTFSPPMRVQIEPAVPLLHEHEHEHELWPLLAGVLASIPFSISPSLSHLQFILTLNNHLMFAAR